MNIAIIEDDSFITLFLKNSLEELGQNVIASFDNAKSFYDFLEDEQNSIDLVFMDILIKGTIDGIEAGVYLRQKQAQSLLVFITSFNNTETIQLAKEANPSGYLIKPISFNNLEATIMVMENLKENETKKEIEKTINISSYTYNKITKIIYKDNNPINLSRKEQICLNILIQNKNIYTSQEGLILSIWGNEENNGLNSLRELLFRLRKKLPDLEIKNSPNLGYILFY